MLIKQKRMKQNVPSHAFSTQPPNRATKFLTAAWSAIEANELRKIPQNELCRYLGIVPSTFINWTCSDAHLHQIETLLRLLERLPTPARMAMIERFLRAHPTIESEQLAHAPATISKLRLILAKQCGLTLILGGTEFSRSFVFTALGHSRKREAPDKAALRGIDVHVPDWFTPIEGLTYLPASTTTTTLRDQAAQAWDSIGHSSWLMLDGVWTLLPDRQKEILIRSLDSHVVIADAAHSDACTLRRIKGSKDVPIHILDVTESSEGRIHIAVRSK